VTGKHVNRYTTGPQDLALYDSYYHLPRTKVKVCFFI
jgi:hypothetical protein